MADQIPQQMRAATIKDFNKGYKVKDVKTPTDLGPNDVLIKIAAAGYCHTDLQVQQGVYASAGAKPGLVGSHEPVGTIIKLGSEAGKQGLEIGDRVGSINTYGFCGKCNSCNHGKQVCDNLVGMLGLTLDGGFAQYMKADARVVAKIPQSIPWAEAAPLFCAGATVYGALCAAQGQKDQWLAIIGVGGLGHLCVQYAKALGYKVVVIDNRQEGLDLANDVPSHLKPDCTYLINTDEAQKKVVEELQTSFYDTNPGVDRVIITTEARSLVRFGQQFLRKGGFLVDVGLPADGPFEVDPFALNFKEQTVRGALICTPERSREMTELHAKNGCKTHVEKTFSVEQANEMAEHYLSKQLKGRLCMVF
ncbi:alcohol dehydrogenase GroES-like domain-containing protein [Colletotrichum orchidophilum]|uniref:Alcohol dehydrogenase GroES-like domain-containing protein n=1 Tax=Colletotrichum orchidophilum TaxID=1209926 RepID=A0A1G4BQL9_9PEZI|nr:alcohol dehydrogenase GroES-like domain-containing protein [Colletotrichum orchidophilum]OHF03596.1 alcohol dehydrogenase GroES-like domain-containing protein [Colletotrichum orchidophilum]